MKIVIIGLSITSSWGNGHATTYRSLLREMTKRGHDVLFLERDVEWYASNRDMPKPPFARAELYATVDELKQRFAPEVRNADAVIVGSYVPEGALVGEWVAKITHGVKAFYDIDTPVTFARLFNGDVDYLSRALVAKYDLYLSFTGGPLLPRVETELGSPMARALYCSFDPELYFPEPQALKWDLGYMGTYSDDRQPQLDALMLEAARGWPQGRFTVSGPMYPVTIEWPRNVARVVHLPPREHRAFYNAQRFTLNITRAEMRAAGYSPSVRLFEAAACGTPIISDYWDGLGELFEIGKEILISRSAVETLTFLREMPEEERWEVGARACKRVLREHTAAHRAGELERYLNQVRRDTRDLNGTERELQPADLTMPRTRSAMRPAYSPESYVYSPAL